MAVFFLAPLGLVFAISFASRGTYGGIVWEFTSANYLDLLHPLYGKILAQSLWYATVTTVLCFVLGFPLAYVIARSPARWQPVFLLLVMLPFWTNFLVRTYAWMILLRHDGLINRGLMALGVVGRSAGIALYADGGRDRTGLWISAVYGVAALCRGGASGSSIGGGGLGSLCLALGGFHARDTSAHQTGHRGRFHPGVHSLDRLIHYAGSPREAPATMMIGNLIQHEYLVVRDWPLGSAVSFVLMGVVMAAVGAVLPKCLPDGQAIGGTMRRGLMGLNAVSLSAMVFLYGPIFVLVLYSFNAAHLSMAWRGRRSNGTRHSCMTRRCLPRGK